MSRFKGMSQVLSLIVAASVLMMVGLSVTFIATDVIGGVGESTENCVQTVKQECKVRDAPSISIPSACVTQNANNKDVITDSLASSGFTLDDASETGGTGDLTQDDVLESADHIECN